MGQKIGSTEHLSDAQLLSVLDMAMRHLSFWGHGNPEEANRYWTVAMADLKLGRLPQLLRFT